MSLSSSYGAHTAKYIVFHKELVVEAHFQKLVTHNEFNSFSFIHEIVPHCVISQKIIKYTCLHNLFKICELHLNKDFDCCRSRND